MTLQTQVTVVWKAMFFAAAATSNLHVSRVGRSRESRVFHFPYRKYLSWRLFVQYCSLSEYGIQSGVGGSAHYTSAKEVVLRPFSVSGAEEYLPCLRLRASSVNTNFSPSFEVLHRDIPFWSKFRTSASQCSQICMLAGVLGAQIWLLLLQALHR